MYPLSQHRQKTFIVGFASLKKSILSIAKELLFRSDNPYKYVLTYKLSQDHLEMFFFHVLQLEEDSIITLMLYN